MQGRQDSDRYKTALNVMSNYFPLEEASCLRRQGFRYVGHTKAGAAAKLIGFDFSTASPYQLEFTNGWVRFIQGNSFVGNGTNTIESISTASPAVVKTTTVHGYTTNDTIFFSFQANPAIPTTLHNRQFVITVTDTYSFSIKDALTGLAIDGSTIGFNTPVPYADPPNHTVTRIAELATPYTAAQWANLRFVQDEATVTLFVPGFAPREITRIATSFGFAIGVKALSDGPYLDVNTTTTTLTPSAATGSVTITASSIVGINGGAGFATTDVGRHIRMYSPPADWDVTKTTYAVGDQVQYVDGNQYVALKAGAHQTGVVPTNIDHWALLPYLPTWCWLTITAFTSTTVVTATINQSTQSTNKTLFNTLATKIWRLGLFSDTTGWPTCGTYHESRLWTAGVTVNRIDGTMSNTTGTFSPTGDDGTIADDNAVSATIKANENNPILWLSADENGLIFGTVNSSWRIRASQLDDPVTPSSVQARRLNKTGVYNAEPVLADTHHIYIQAAQRNVMELSSAKTVVGDKNDNLNLSLTSAHLSKTGFLEVAYTQNPQPIVWARRTDGQLVGAHYSHEDTNVSVGWFKAPLGHSRKVESISQGPSTDGLTNRLYIVSNDASTNIRWIEMLTDVFDDNKEDYQTWFVDAGTVPPAVKLATLAVEGFDGLRAYGLWYANGATVSATVGGMDIGDAVVSNGHADYPFTTTFTSAYLQSLIAETGYTATVDYGPLTVASVWPDNTNKLLELDSGASAVPVSGVTDQDTFVDYARSRVLVIKNGNTATDGIRVFPIDNIGTQSSAVGHDTIFASASALNTVDVFGSMITYDGALCFSKNANNNWSFVKLDPTTFVVAATLTHQFSIISPITDATPMRDAHGNNFALLTGQSTFIVVNTDTMSSTPILNDTAVDENRCISGPGPVENGAALAYVLGRDTYGAGSTTAPLGLYEIRAETSTTTKTKIGTITPAQVDATWSHFIAAYGIIFDRTDGNLMIFVKTDDVVTNKNYIVKINRKTAAVMWKIAVNAMPNRADNNINRCFVDGGKFAYLSPTVSSGSLYPMYVIDTIAGTTVTTQWSNVQGTGAQLYDARLGLIYFYGSYSQITTPPTSLIGTYFAVPNTTYSNKWAAAGAGPPIDRSIFDRSVSSEAGYSSPIVIGYTYTSQGQILRPDHGNDAGARNGPAFGKKRRNHWFAALLNRTQNIKFGTDFGTTLKPAKLTTAGGTAIAQPTLFSGIITETITDDYSFNGMLSWQQTRPVPGHLLIVGGYIESIDK